MKKIKLFYLLIVLLCFFSSAVYGQRKELTFDEYENLKNKIDENTRKNSYRLINDKTIYAPDGTKIQQTEKIISEYVPLGRQRILSQITNYEINRDTAIEIIKIDGTEYKKYNNGKWEIVSARTIKGGLNIMPEKKYVKYYLTENVSIGNQTVNIMEFEEEYISKINSAETGEVVETTIYQNWKWISKDDLWLSFEMINEKVNPKTLIVRSVWNFEYDSNIKIETPVINK